MGSLLGYCLLNTHLMTSYRGRAETVATGRHRSGASCYAASGRRTVVRSMCTLPLTGFECYRVYVLRIAF